MKCTSLKTCSSQLTVRLLSTWMCIRTLLAAKYRLGWVQKQINSTLWGSSTFMTDLWALPANSSSPKETRTSSNIWNLSLCRLRSQFLIRISRMRRKRRGRRTRRGSTKRRGGGGRKRGWSSRRLNVIRNLWAKLTWVILIWKRWVNGKSFCNSEEFSNSLFRNNYTCLS